MKQKKKENFFNLQQGSMLMELMLSLALAMIIIPFVFRYQKNTIERARNIAVVKQMETVQAALERCIFENRSEIVNQGVSVLSENNTDSTKIDCLILSNYEGDAIKLRGLVNYGLTNEFANDFKDDYKLRILRTADHTGQPVLQGVVLLNSLDNQNINALRTREIVRLGGGQIGFIDGNDVQGGYGSFKTVKSDFGFQNFNAGILQTTGTMRGDSKYLWRLPSDSEEDATMLSDLNLDGHNIENIKSLKGKEAYFHNLVLNQKSEAKNVHFTGENVNPTTNSSGIPYNGQEARVQGALSNASNDVDIDVMGTLKLTNDSAASVFSNSFLDNLTAKMVSLNNFTIASKSLDSGNLFVPEINAQVVNVGSLALIPSLNISRQICSVSDNGRQNCWYATKSQNIAKFKDVNLTSVSQKYLSTLLEREAEQFISGGGGKSSVPGSGSGNVYREPYKRVFASEYLLGNTETAATALTALTRARQVVDMKYDLVDACGLYLYSGNYTSNVSSSTPAVAPKTASDDPFYSPTNFCETTKDNETYCKDWVQTCVEDAFTYIPNNNVKLANYTTVMRECHQYFGLNLSAGGDNPGTGGGIIVDPENPSMGRKTDTGQTSSYDFYSNDFEYCLGCLRYVDSSAATAACLNMVDGIFVIRERCEQYYEAPTPVDPGVHSGGTIIVSEKDNDDGDGKDTTIIGGLIDNTKGGGSDRGAQHGDIADEFAYCRGCRDYIETGQLYECLDCVDGIIKGTIATDLGTCVRTYEESMNHQYIVEECAKRYSGTSFPAVDDEEVNTKGGTVTNMYINPEGFCRQCLMYAQTDETTINNCLDCVEWKIQGLTGASLKSCVTAYGATSNQISANLMIREHCAKYEDSGLGSGSLDDEDRGKGGGNQNYIANQFEFCNSCNNPTYVQSGRVGKCLRCVDRVIQGLFPSLEVCMATS